MLKFNGNQVFFKYYPDETGLISGENGTIVFYCGRTECIITERNPKTEEDEVIYYGEAYCSVNDTFDKSVGRKLSLARALETAPKDFRTKVWKLYLETVRVK